MAPVKKARLLRYAKPDQKDTRYAAVKAAIEKGRITSPVQIFEIIPLNVVCKDLRMGDNRFREALQNPALYMLEDAYNLAGVIGVDPRVMMSILYDYFMANSKPASRRQPKNRS